MHSDRFLSLYLRQCNVVSRQRGVVLIIALIVLVAMTLAGIGLIRSVTTGSLIAGNMAFKQSAVSAADPEIDGAFNWIQAQAGTGSLSNDNNSRGYVSSGGVPDWNAAATWQNAFPAAPVADAAGNRVQVLIHRMCLLPNLAWNAAGNQCAQIVNPTAASGGSKAVGAFKYNTAPMIYYRITARVQGPRNTASFIQMTVTGPQS